MAYALRSVPDSLYHNNGDGIVHRHGPEKFLPHIVDFSSMGADFGDVNNDGLVDFFVADMAGTTHEKDQHVNADARSRGEERPDDAPGAPKAHRNALLLSTGTGYVPRGRLPLRPDRDGLDVVDAL